MPSVREKKSKVKVVKKSNKNSIVLLGEFYNTAIDSIRGMALYREAGKRIRALRPSTFQSMSKPASLQQHFCNTP